MACDLIKENQKEQQSHYTIGQGSWGGKTELNKNTAHHECIALFWSVLQLRPYLEGHKLTICTDQGAWQRIAYSVDVSGKLTHWRFRSSEFELDVVHRPSIKIQAADAFLWLETCGAI